MYRYLPWIVAALLSVAAVVVGETLIEDEEPRPPAPTTQVDGPDRDRKRDDPIKLSPRAQSLAERGHPDVAPDTPEELRGNDRQPTGVLPQGGGSQSFPGCQTRFVGSYSARTRSVKGIGLHYTAGPNSPGLADMNGLTAYSNRNQVSWHFLIDREGNCFYSVPLAGKAWTIGNLNSETTNIEVVGRGNEGDYAGSAGMAKLAQVVREIGRRQGIPIQLGATDGRCNMTRRGIITHWMGGGCSGGHHDIRPYVIEQVIRRIRSGGAVSPLTPVERQVAAKRCHHLRHDGAKNRWARHYRDRILVPGDRVRRVGGEVQLVEALDRAKARDRRPWSHRKRGARRATLIDRRAGKGCS